MKRWKKMCEIYRKDMKTCGKHKKNIWKTCGKHRKTYGKHMKNI